MTSNCLCSPPFLLPPERQTNSIVPIAFRYSSFNFLLLVIVALNGCSQKDLQNAYDSAKSQTEELASSTQEIASTAKESVSTAVKAVEAKLPSKGSMTLQSDLTIPNPRRASVELIVIGDGRANVVQICSYDPTSKQLIYPAVLIHGQTDLAAIGDLPGTSVSCDMYLQADPSSTIAMTTAGGHVDVQFGQFNPDDKTLSATIKNGELIGSDQKIYKVSRVEVVATIRSEDD